MISAKDLMIGDWVKSRGKIEQVREVYDGFICTDSFEDSHDYYFKPIPLTTKILKKNGFELQELGGDRVALWTGFGEDNCHDIEVEFDGDKPIHLKIDGPVYLVTPNIKYLHQLQHFLRDCETGKEIEL